MSDGVGRVGLPRRTLLTGGIAVAFLVVVGAVLGPEGLLSLFVGADPATFAVALACIVVAVACWGEAQRRLLVAAGATLSPRQGFLGYGTGMFAKQVLPGGHAFGPGLVAYAFRSLTRRSYSETFAAVTPAELCDFVASGLSRPPVSSSCSAANRRRRCLRHARRCWRSGVASASWWASPGSARGRSGRAPTAWRG